MSDRPPADTERFHAFRRGWIHGAGFRAHTEPRTPDYERGWDAGRAAFGAAMRAECKALGIAPLQLHPSGDPAASLADSGVTWTRRCDQCGQAQADWQEPDAWQCPSHANPFGSCDGKLVPPVGVER